MTVTQEVEVNINQPKKWGLDRIVEIQRGCNINLGFSIIGGKIDAPTDEINTGEQKSSGVFIKSIDPDASVSNNCNLKIGDRIVEVNGVNVLNCNCDKVAEIIKKNEDIVRLRVQSLTLMEQSDCGQLIEAKINNQQSLMKKRSPSSNSEVDITLTPSTNVTEHVAAIDAAVDQEKHTDEHPDTDESSESEDERYMEGNIHTKAGMEISRKSAGNVKRTAGEITADPEDEDEYGYTALKILKKYRALSGQVLLEKIDRTTGDLGIALSGHKDRSKMAVFICGLNPKGNAYKAGNLKVGDEILEVNGHVLQGRCHLNASVVIKGMCGPTLKLIIHRNSPEINELAVKIPIHFPAAFDESDRYSGFEGVRTVSLKKGLYGLGIMIVEGKHAQVGQGIFISDIQEGSVAERGGLLLGDMILGVNSDSLLGSTYDQATAVLKRVEGMVTVTVCNPNQNKQKDQSDRNEPSKASTGAATTETSVGQTQQSAEVKTSEGTTDPKNVKTIKGKPITVEITKTKESPLGLIITGGSDTSCGGVFILDIYPDGLAEKTGQLKRGDQILEFCQENFKAIEHEKAATTILTASGPIKMSILQDDHSTEEVEVELHRKPMKGIGLGLTAFKCGKGAYISELLTGCSAAESGKLEIGDIVISLSGQNVEETETDEIANLIKAINPVLLKVKRFKAKS
ncbi:inactivation-no-after-potential D protein [Diachasma alloeum]|uniref:inactivation-no-after-potential D protein n=1 Tax=Diachasma alloeum TaxID=454923 RepID=UPI00073850F5|nr:inactivation-no-after-potential D protein [Diachasma alloeum]XP_015118834.1 inactivation-no-after-potential D protein [Diachasma alloeum]